MCHYLVDLVKSYPSFQRVFTRKKPRRYSRERALRSLVCRPVPDHTLGRINSHGDAFSVSPPIYIPHRLSVRLRSSQQAIEHSAACLTGVSVLRPFRRLTHRRANCSSVPPTKLIFEERRLPQLNSKSKSVQPARSGYLVSNTS